MPLFVCEGSHTSIALHKPNASVPSSTYLKVRIVDIDAGRRIAAIAAAAIDAVIRIDGIKARSNATAKILRCVV